MLQRNNIQEIINVEDHDNFIQNNDKCIMFFGSNNCNKCDSMNKIYDNIAKNYPQIKFSHVEVTKTEVENLGNSLPVFVCYKNNVPVGKVVGPDENGIINMIQNNYNQPIKNNYNQPIKNLTMLEITNLLSYNKFVTTNKKCIVFFGSEKCPHCRNIKPLIVEMVNKYPSVKFCHIEVTRETIDIIPYKYKDVGFPLFICYKDNVLVDVVLGENQEGIIQMIKNNLT